MTIVDDDHTKIASTASEVFITGQIPERLGQPTDEVTQVNHCCYQDAQAFEMVHHWQTLNTKNYKHHVYAARVRLLLLFSHLHFTNEFYQHTRSTNSINTLNKQTRPTHLHTCYKATAELRLSSRPLIFSQTVSNVRNYQETKTLILPPAFHTTAPGYYRPECAYNTSTYGLVDT